MPRCPFVHLILLSKGQKAPKSGPFKNEGIHEGVDIKAVVLGDASIEKKTSSKTKNLICIVGEKGKVLLTVFSDQ